MNSLSSRCDKFLPTMQVTLRPWSWIIRGVGGEKTPKFHSSIHVNAMTWHSLHWSFDVFVARLMVIIGKNIPLYKIWRRCVVPSSPRRMPRIQAHPQSLGSCVCPRCRVSTKRWMVDLQTQSLVRVPGKKTKETTNSFVEERFELYEMIK